MLDILNNSIEEIYMAHMNAAYAHLGGAPEGGYEPPAATMLARTTQAYSDLHIELAPLETDVNISYAPVIAPVNYFQEEPPRDSDPPFYDPFEQYDPPGLFGQALKAYSKVVCVCSAYGIDPKAYESWFKADWGIDQNEDLSMFAAIPRSKGATLWAGISRVLQPYCAALTSAQPAVNVKIHNKSRTDFGENALINWPRVHAIATAIGVQLVADDEFAQGKFSRIDFAIVRADVAKAPSNVKMDLPVATTKVVNPYIMETIKRLKATMQRFIIKPKESLVHVELEDTVLDMPVQPLRKEAIETIGGVPVDMLSVVVDLFDDENIEILEKPKKRHQTTLDHSDTVQVLPADTVLKSVVAHIVDIKEGNFPRGQHLQNLLLDMEDDNAQVSKHAIHLARQYVEQIFPKDFLERVAMLFKMIWPLDYHKRFADLQTHLNMPGTVKSRKSLIKQWEMTVTNYNALYTIIEDMRDGAFINERLRKTQPEVSHRLVRLLSHGVTFAQGLDGVIHVHGRYWANRYISKMKTSGDFVEKVRLQLLAKFFRHIKLKGDKELHLTLNEACIVSTFDHAAKRYIEKRRGYDEKEDQHGINLTDKTEKVAAALDDWVRACTMRVPNPSFRSMVDVCVDQSDLFIKDIMNVIKKVWLPVHYNEYPVVVDDLDIPEVDEQFSEPPKKMVKPDLSFLMAKMKQSDEKPKPIKRAEPVEVQAPMSLAQLRAQAAALSSKVEVIASDSDDDEYNSMAGKVDLAQELRDDVPTISVPLCSYLVAKHGMLVTYNDYKQILIEAKALILQHHNAPIAPLME